MILWNNFFKRIIKSLYSLYYAQNVERVCLAIRRDNAQAYPWGIIFCPISSHSMGFPLKYNSTIVNKFINIYVYCVLNRAARTKKDTERQNIFTLVTLKFRRVYNSLSFWHSYSEPLRSFSKFSISCSSISVP